VKQDALSRGRFSWRRNFLDEGPIVSRYRGGHDEGGLAPDRQQPLEFFVNGRRTVLSNGMDTQHKSCVVRCLCLIPTGMALLPQWQDAEDHIG